VMCLCGYLTDAVNGSMILIPA